MTDVTTSSGYTGKLPILTKIAHGVGSGAFGVKDNGFNYFLLFFYGTVLGVDGRLVGLALLIALICDAISDPIVGYISDNWRSKWGRRHPFMYAAALPASFSFYLLWQPPDASETVLFVYLTVLAILIRTLLTFFQTPSSALNAELTQDYDERSSLAAYRLYFGWTLGNLMTIVAYGFLFVSSATYADGRLDPENYRVYGIVGSILIFIFIMVSALGTHSRIPHLQAPPPKRKIRITTIFKEVFETLSNKSFAALFGAYLFGAIASGVSAALAFIMYTYFWQFSTVEIRNWGFFVFLAAVIGFLVAPMAAKKLGKKKAVLIIGSTACFVAPLPYLLRLLGWFPENGDPILFPLFVFINVFDLGLIIAMQALFVSMVADLVEENQVKTGRRSEGVFYAAVTFIRKSTLGLGALAAGFILEYARLPQGADPQSVSEDVLWRMGAAYVPTIWILYGCLLTCLCFYKIDRNSHEENLRKLAERH